MNVSGSGPRMPQIPQIPEMSDEMAPQTQVMEAHTAMTLQMLPPHARQAYLESLQAEQAEAEKETPEQAPDSDKVASISTPDADVWTPSILDVPISDLRKPDPEASVAYNAIIMSGSSNPFPANPFTYTGREDDGTGLYYYRGRYYDPELEVFISQDPKGNAQRYVQGNSIRYRDPLGRVLS
jgi:RHS repeat-associated protein